MSSAYANAQQFFVAVAAGALLMSVIAAPATAAPLVSWRMINGIVKAGDAALGVFGTIELWTTINGSATVDLGAGTLQFNVLGLTVAEGDAIGTTLGVTNVHGTIACKTAGGATASVSASVPLGPDGNASFSGPITIPAACTASNIAFLITVPAPLRISGLISPSERAELHTRSTNPGKIARCPQHTSRCPDSAATPRACGAAPWCRCSSSDMGGQVALSAPAQCAA
jgi:hypothetical protein